MRIKSCRIVGARPQFMQAAMLRREMARRGHEEVLVHTGQHYDDAMSRIFFEELELPAPEFNLGIGSATQGAQTGRMLIALEPVIETARPDVVVIDGDTNSTLAGALAAAKMGVPLVHVESGMRSFDRRMPEEVNRVVADHISDLLCAPTRTATQNLVREGLSARAVETGDLMYDAFMHYRGAARADALDVAGVSPGEYVLATIHRAENTSDQDRFYALLNELSRMPATVVFPVHPRVTAWVEAYCTTRGETGNLRPIRPVGYLQMLALEQHARCIVTDSGGVQREAYFAGVPSVVLRETTEWREQLDSGWTVLAPPGSGSVSRAYARALDHPPQRAAIYGEGDAAARIVTAMEAFLA